MCGFYGSQFAVVVADGVATFFERKDGVVPHNGQEPYQTKLVIPVPEMLKLFREMCRLHREERARTASPPDELAAQWVALAGEITTGAATATA